MYSGDTISHVDDLDKTMRHSDAVPAYERGIHVKEQGRYANVHLTKLPRKVSGSLF